MVWLMVVLLCAAVSGAVTYPLRKKVEALESMVEMLSKAVRGEYERGE